MFLEFTATDVRYPRWVRVFNIPTYFLAFLLGVAFPRWQPYSFFAVSLLTVLLYSFFFSGAVRSFFRSDPPRPVWQFVCAVVLAQAIVLSAALYLLAA